MGTEGIPGHREDGIQQEKDSWAFPTFMQLQLLGQANANRQKIYVTACDREHKWDDTCQ